ncbi:MAG: hypothetical protein FJ290_28640 [Planctomycetes bacterium]|nr:hypothetical protein [Planctomycetota bacterium]
MIRIRRPSAAPAILADKGKKKQRALCSAYSRAPKAYKTGAKTFSFDSGVYGHGSVKTALIAMQHGKCCFCESKITHIAYGDVEHFRPKAGYRQQPGDGLSRPGYYWLAYEWSNLFLACELCNRRFKECLFPLRDSSQRATCHKHDLDREEPLLLDPTQRDPEDHLSFRGEVAYAVEGSQAGIATIEVLGLNREPLVERRRDKLEQLRVLHSATLVTSPALAAEARAILQRATAEAAEYAAMVRTASAAAFSIIGP